MRHDRHFGGGFRLAVRRDTGSRPDRVGVGAVDPQDPVGRRASDGPAVPSPDRPDSRRHRLLRTARPARPGRIGTARAVEAPHECYVREVAEESGLQRLVIGRRAVHVRVAIGWPGSRMVAALVATGAAVVEGLGQQQDPLPVTATGRERRTTLAPSLPSGRRVSPSMVLDGSCSAPGDPHAGRQPQ